MWPIGRRKAKTAPNPEELFRWTDETITDFRNSFRAGAADEGGRPRTQISGPITQRIDSQHSWDLKIETEYYGWMFLDHIWPHRTRLRRLPFRMTLFDNAEVYVERDPRQRSSLPPIGRGYLYTRGDDPPHGFDFELGPDRRRFRSFLLALRRHRSALAPWVTFELMFAKDSDSPKPTGPYDIVAYWLETFPIDHGGALKHPYVRGKLDGF